MTIYAPRWESVRREPVRVLSWKALLTRRPVSRPTNWTARVSVPLAANELGRVRVSIGRGRPYAVDKLVRQTAKARKLGERPVEYVFKMTRASPIITCGQSTRLEEVQAMLGKVLLDKPECPLPSQRRDRRAFAPASPGRILPACGTAGIPPLCWHVT